MKTTDKIRKQLSDHPVILYMKGTPEEPRCGFSAKAASVLKATQVGFAHVDVLSSPLIMQALPEVSEFP
ncbi:MAG: glutaredoxin domain-containing protein, partial [Candidatus Thiodiazotropha taylori]